MNLNEISRNQALIDLRLANVRIMELTCRIDEVAREVHSLRTELRIRHKEQQGHSPSGNGVEVTRETANSVGTEHAETSRQTTDKKKTDRSWKLLKSLFGRPARTELFANIESVCNRPVTRGGARLRSIVSRSEFPALTISGWVFCPSFDIALEAVDLILIRTGHSDIQTTSRTSERDDVSAHFDSKLAIRSGFIVAIPMRDIPSGQYLVQLRGRNARNEEATLDVMDLEIT